VGSAGKNMTPMGDDPEQVDAFTPGGRRGGMEVHVHEAKVIEPFPWLIAEASKLRR